MALAAVLMSWFLWPFLAEGARFPVGPDGPVYLWWTRLAGAEGLSAVGHRPGASALTLVLSGATGASVVQATAALEVALGVAVGLCGAALLRRRTTPLGSWLGGLLAGTFAVHLAAGYLANLAFVPAFLATATFLDQERPRATVLAACALGAGGLAHPLFLVLGIVVLLGAAAGAIRTDPHEARRLTAVAGGGAAIAGAGLLALLAGPRPPEVDTSKDAFLRRAGLGAELREAYLDRFVHRWARYVQWVSVPLALLGSPRLDGPAGRILRSWLWMTIAGVVLALATGLLPADRFVTFGFAVPLLAAVGLERVREGRPVRRLVAGMAVVVAVLLMLAGSAIAWGRQEPFLSPDEVRAATTAGELLEDDAPQGPVAFLVDDADASVTFLASRAGNVIRASLPPGRIRDVVVVVPPRGTDDPVRDALEQTTASDLRRAGSGSGREAPVIVLTPFFEGGPAPEGSLVLDGDERPPPGDPTDPLEPSSPTGIAIASLGTLGLLWMIGFGWARLGLADPVRAAAASPAVGMCAVVSSAVALDLVGVRIGSGLGAIAVAATAGGSGYLFRFVLERRARAGPSPQVQEEPGE